MANTYGVGPADPGQFFNTVGAKLGQFGHWLGDVTGLNGAQAPAMREIDYGQANESRAQQDALLRQLQQQYAAMAAGNGPSLAQGQLQQATDANIRNAMALGAAQQGQGLGYASALRNIADQSAAARQQAAAQSAMIRNAEQMQGMQGMGGIAGMYGGMRGQDLGQSGMTADNAYRYDALKAGIDAQNAAGRRQFTGQVLGAIGSTFSPGGPLSGLFKSGGGGGLTDLADPMNAWAQGPTLTEATPMSSGGRVPGYAQGGALDSRANDTVPAMLSPGEIVLPRSISLAPDAADRAKLFVEAIQARRARGQQSDEHPAVRHMRKAA